MFISKINSQHFGSNITYFYVNKQISKWHVLVLGQTTSDVTTQSSTLVTETTSDKTTPTTLDTTTPLESTTATSTTEIPTTTLSPTTISSSTTEVPVPTSSSAPPSTKAPGPEKCQFNVTEGNVTCIRAELQAEFIIDAGVSCSEVILSLLELL